MKYPYRCILSQQRPNSPSAPRFVIFTASAGEILKWASIERLAPDEPQSPQRIEKPYKVNAVRRFFEVDEANTIPSTIVIGLRKGSSELIPVANCEQIYTLNVTVEEAAPAEQGGAKNGAKNPPMLPGTIVDGQHRVLGIAQFDPGTPINVVGLLDVDDAEVAFQFLVINNKAAKVSSDHLRALALNYAEDDLTTRLRNVHLGLDINLKFVGFANDLAESPFKGMLALPTNPEENRIVPPAAIEDAIKYIKAQNLPEFSEDDMVLSIFFGIWNVLKEQWPENWDSKSRLLTKVSIVGLTKFLADSLLRRFDWGELDLFEPTAVDAELRKVIRVLAPEFWSQTTEWIAKGLDTSAGRKLFNEALEQMVRNSRQRLPWHTDIGMVQIAVGSDDFELAPAVGGA